MLGRGGLVRLTDGTAFPRYQNMTIANFKTMVAGYMNRTAASFTGAPGGDILLLAMNDARRDAQLAHDFELLRTEDAYLSTHAGGANWQTGCKTTPGGGTAILMKRIDEVWNASTLTIGATTYYPRTTRIPYGYTGQMKRELSVVDGVFVTDALSQNYSIQNKFAYAVGSQLFVTTVTTATNFKLVGIQWADDLTGSESPDMFLTYFTNWFKFATILALNVYLKDSERFPIDAAVAQRAFELVKTADGTIANMGESVNLD